MVAPGWGYTRPIAIVIPKTAADNVKSQVVCSSPEKTIEMSKISPGFLRQLSCLHEI